MADELKPCPFCEQQAEVGRYGNPRLSTIIECTNCGSRVESSDQYPDHARSWNHRPIEDALRAEVAKYRGMEVENAGLRADNEELGGELAAIGKDAPKALAALGSRLTEMLADDQWNEVEPMLAAIQLGHADEIAALKAADSHCLCRADIYQLEQQVAAKETECQRLRDLVESRAQEIAALKARYETPLTDEQAGRLHANAEWTISPRGWQEIDAAIRAAREGAR